MSGSELHIRVSLWKLLSTRRDVDQLTLELIGKFEVERMGCAIPETADRLAFHLACQLEMIFDLQRTHLQSLTPYGDFTNRADAARERVVERLPYLLSPSTAKGAFAYLAKLATQYLEKFTGAQNGDVSLRRITFVRALLSGARMLCLHPNVAPGDKLSPSVQYRPDFDLRERVLAQVCNTALERVPERHQNLHLRRMSENLFPLDELTLTYMANQCAADFLRDPMGKYWTLYDISWSVVAAFIQFNTTGARVTTYAFGPLATNIANIVMEQAPMVLKYGEEWIVLLLNVIEVLSPVLAADIRGNGSPWSDIYESILNDRDHEVPVLQLYRDHDSRRIAALSNFQAALEQRGVALRDSDEELPALLSHIEAVCADAAALCRGHSSIPSPGSRSADALKLYIANCGLSHPIAHGPFLSELLNIAANRGMVWENGFLNFPERERCPSCLAGESGYFTRLRAISPLNKVLDVVNQKNQELKFWRRQRQFNYNIPIQRGASVTSIDGRLNRRPSSRDAPIPVENESFNSPKPPDRGLSYRRPVSSMPPSPIVSDYSHQPRFGSPEPQSPGFWTNTTSGMFGFISGRGKNKSLRGMRTPSSSASSGKLDLRPQSIGLAHLGPGKKNVVLSADCSRFIFWTDTTLAVHDSEGLKTCVPVSIRNRALATASRNLCAVIGQEPSFYEIGYYSLREGFERRSNTYSEFSQCFALSPDDAYLAVGLKSGSVRVSSPRGGTQTRVLDLKVHGHPPVVGLSFSADTTELVVSVRLGDTVAAYTYLMPDATFQACYTFPRYLREREADDQGVSSVIRCPSRNLLCVTSWTVSGVPLLYDCGTKKTRLLNKKETGLEIGNRIYQAAFSKSGKILVLINDSGGVFKLTIDNINSFKARKVSTARRVVRKSHVIGQPQLLDMKISDDESYIRVAWIDSGNDNQAQVSTICFDPNPMDVNLLHGEPSSPARHSVFSVES